MPYFDDCNERQVFAAHCKRTVVHEKENVMKENFMLGVKSKLLT